MNSRNIKAMKLVGIFFLGGIFFNYPILSLFNSDTFVMGLPLFYVCLFTGWAVIVILIFIIMETGLKQKSSEKKSKSFK